jgi:hypothetical protein
VLRDKLCASLASHVKGTGRELSAAFVKVMRKTNFVHAAWSPAYRIGEGDGARTAVLLLGAVRSGHVFAWRFEAAPGSPLRLASEHVAIWVPPKRAQQPQQAQVSAMLVPCAHSASESMRAFASLQPPPAIAYVGTCAIELSLCARARACVCVYACE